MLTRNCAIENLFNEDDFNVRVTVFNGSNISNDPSKQKAAWILMIDKSIGRSITHSSSVCDLTICTEDGYVVSQATTRGKYIIGNIDITFKSPRPIRVSVKPRNSSKERVWIFL